MKKHQLALYLGVPLLSTSPVIADKHFTPTPSPQTIYSVGDSLKLSNGSRIGFIGGGLGSRMNIFNEFETELQRRYPQHKLYIRNFCKEGDTPGFRPHPSRANFYAFPGAKELMPQEFQKGAGKGHFASPDQWLEDHKIDTLIGFFGYSSSFGGASDLERYKKEFRAFIDHTLQQNYNGKSNLRYRSNL